MLFKRRNLLKINRIRNNFFYLFKDKKIYFSKNYNEYLEKILQKINELFLVPAPPSQPQLDPRAQGHKRKIIAYDDL